MKAALRHRVLEEAILSRSGILFILILIGSGKIKSPKMNSLKGAFMYLIFYPQESRQNIILLGGE